MARPIFAASILALALWTVTTTQAAAHMLFDTDFSHLREWNYSGNTTTRSVTAPDGKGRAARFVLDRRTDSVPYRSELVMDSAQVPREVRNARFGQEYWYAFDIWLEDYQADTGSEILFQFHEVPDRDSRGNRLEPYRNPPLAIGVNGRDWYIVSRGDTKKITPDRQSYTHHARYDGGRWQANRWTHWVVRVRWDWGPDGLLQIWRDGEMVVNQRGTNTFNDDVGPYLKTGIYKYNWQNRATTNVNRRVIYYGNLRVARGPNLFELVSTQSSPLPRPPSRPSRLQVEID